MSPQPDFIASRLEMWDRLKRERDEFMASQEQKPIEVTLPDGKVVDGNAWKTTPYDIASGISKGRDVV